MKSIAELEAIKKKVLDNVNLRKEREEGVRVVIGMATCGIAAGARDTLNAISEELAKEMNITTANLYNIHRRALQQLKVVMLGKEVFNG